VHEANQIFRVAPGFKMLADQARHGEVGGAVLFDEDRMY